MHLVLGLSGSQLVLEQVKSELNSQSFWTTRTHAITGKKELYKVQGTWRPLELGHYVFPEDCLNQVINMLSINEYPKMGESKFESVKHLDKYKMIMRKLLNLKKIPETLPPLKKEDEKTIFWHEHLNIIPFGIKEDGKGVRQFGEGGPIYDQEWL